MSHGVESKIIIIGNQRLILDRDLAKLYGVTTKRLNQQDTRNLERFPKDILEVATSSIRNGGRRKPPRVFTEFDVVMAANVLNSKIAIDANNTTG